MPGETFVHPASGQECGENTMKKRWQYTGFSLNTILTSFNFFRIYLPSAHNRPVVLFSMLILMHLFSMDVAAQATISLVEKDKKRVNAPTADQLTCIRHGTRRPEPKMTVPIELEIGDELIGKAG